MMVQQFLFRNILVLFVIACFSITFLFVTACGGATNTNQQSDGDTASAQTVFESEATDKHVAVSNEILSYKSSSSRSSDTDNAPERSNDTSESYDSSERGLHFKDAAIYRDLLTKLVESYEYPSENVNQLILDDLSIIKNNSLEEYSVAHAVVDNWQRVYGNSSYELCLYSGGQYADELDSYKIPNKETHAFVVLGYQLINGEMQDELIGRCDAAAAASRSYPKTIIVCSGGVTGEGNPDGHSEASLMKSYLIDKCGVRKSRILIDEKAMSTTENASNVMEILHDNNIHSMTIVTSSYHQHRCQAVFNAAAAMLLRIDGYKVKSVGNYCYQIDSPISRDADARLAVQQVAELFELPDEEIELLPSPEWELP